MRKVEIVHSLRYCWGRKRAQTTRRRWGVIVEGVCAGLLPG